MYKRERNKLMSIRFPSVCLASTLSKRRLVPSFHYSYQWVYPPAPEKCQMAAFLILLWSIAKKQNKQRGKGPFHPLLLQRSLSNPPPPPPLLLLPCLSPPPQYVFVLSQVCNARNVHLAFHFPHFITLPFDFGQSCPVLWSWSFCPSLIVRWIDDV